MEEFHEHQTKEGTSDDEKVVARQARAGLLWTKQFYYYVIEDWLKGDADQPAPPKERESRAERVNGDTSTLAIFSRCRMRGSIRGLQPGTRHST